MSSAKERLIFALDVDSFDEAQRWVKLLHDKVGIFKVGKQLFTKCGPAVVKMIQEEGGEVFLDLKYHDIPNTVAKAGVEACRLGARIFDVHALGGSEMMETVVAATDACNCANRPMRIAITILTSSTEETLKD